ncbi:Beta-galactoside alpha-2,6-sialyltransferase 2 [Collichthys lucidus]|uniref:Beta-galactoside alpha-2,6-sialyltransferase 2 n=1 Tax=Collichthys lucidus TaxID=240159 RepID=A0A4U5TYF6_COLLU|nr:Beta-galactoside alpha-2,6-sialyltransferase 2 [Collichthys lucidus]
MKPYRTWLLLVLLVWLVLFLSLLCHFLDLRSSSPLWSRSAAKSRHTRTETRHLVSERGSLRPAGVEEKDWRRQRTDYRSRSKVYSRSKSLEILQRLWTGNLSVGMLSPRLQKVLKVQLSFNRHQVTYEGPRGGRRSGLQLYCELKRRTRIRTVDGTEEPFSGLGWARLVPSLPLQELQNSQYRTCAVVTSAGAILNSSLGMEIGLLLMMSLCGEVSVYEFIPSIRRTDLCHYYERYHDDACTLGAYHPLLYEKLLVQKINQSPPDQLRRGKGGSGRSTVDHDQGGSGRSTVDHDQRGSGRSTVDHDQRGSGRSTVDHDQGGSGRSTVDHDQGGSGRSTVDHDQRGSGRSTVDHDQRGSGRSTVDHDQRGSGRSTVDQDQRGSGRSTVDQDQGGSGRSTVDQDQRGSGRSTVDQDQRGSGRSTVDQYQRGSGRSTVDHDQGGSGRSTVDQDQRGFRTVHCGPGSEEFRTVHCGPRSEGFRTVHCGPRSEGFRTVHCGPRSEGFRTGHCGPRSEGFRTVHCGPGSEGFRTVHCGP